MQELEQALAALRGGDLKRALDLSQAVLARQPQQVDALFLSGSALHRLGQRVPARRALREAVQLAPAHLAANKELALLALAEFDADLVLHCVRRIQQSHPQDLEAHYLGAAAAAVQGRMAEAEQAFAAVAAANPALHDQRLGLAQSAAAGQRYELALTHALAVLRRRPTWFEAWLLLAEIYRAAGDAGQAKAAAERALGLQAQHPRALAIRADAMTELRAPLAEIIAARAAAVAAAPDDLAQLYHYAAACFADYRYPEMHQAMQRLSARQPELITPRWFQSFTPQQAVAPDEASREAFLQQLRAGLDALERLDPARLGSEDIRAALRSANLFHLDYLGQPFLHEHRRYARLVQRLSQRLIGPLAPTPSRRAGTRLRLGVVSGHFFEHSVSKLWIESVLALPAERFELHGFGLGGRQDAWTERWRQGMHSFVQCEQDIVEWVRALRAAELDAILFLDVGMEMESLALASLRLAPLQLAAWGHPVSTGLDEVQAFFSAAECEPDGADAHYSERLIRLPGFGSRFAAPTLTPARDSVPPACEGRVRLLCQQSFWKLHPGHDELFAEVLAQAPEADLWLAASALGHTREALITRMRKRFAAAGVDFDARVTVFGMLPRAEYAALAEAADVLLDSMDWSGGVTTLEALCYGTPIISLPGATMRGRHTLGILRVLGLTQLVAKDRADYQRKLLTLIRDRKGREALRQEIRQRAPKLYDRQDVSEAFAEALWKEAIAAGLVVG